MTCPACGYDPNGDDIQVVPRALLLIVCGEARSLPQRQIELLEWVNIGRKSCGAVTYEFLASQMYPHQTQKRAHANISNLARDTRINMAGMGWYLKPTGHGLCFDQ